MNFCCQIILNNFSEELTSKLSFSIYALVTHWQLLRTSFWQQQQQIIKRETLTGNIFLKQFFKQKELLIEKDFQ